MTTKLNEIFVALAERLEDLSKGNSKESSSYEFEASLNTLFQEFVQTVFQAMVGNTPKSKNDCITILTSMGGICFPQGHPLATPPGESKTNPFVQGQLCRAGTKMTFEETSEEVAQLMGVKVNAKQIGRLCHHYGALLERVDWEQAYSDSAQLLLPLKTKVTYAMMDGNMMLNMCLRRL